MYQEQPERYKELMEEQRKEHEKQHEKYFKNSCLHINILLEMEEKRDN